MITDALLLFSDAQDSEEPGDYKALIQKMTDEGCTISVIGLGTDKDVDSALLVDIAKLGNGRMFCQDTAGYGLCSGSAIVNDPTDGEHGVAVAEIDLNPQRYRPGQISEAMAEQIDDLRDRGRAVGIVSHVADLKDHKLNNYMKRIEDKITASRQVPYNQRENYIAKKKAVATLQPGQ